MNFWALWLISLQEGIFRLAGEQTEIKRLKEIMNKKEFVSSNDINTIASLIKVFSMKQVVLSAVLILNI